VRILAVCVVAGCAFHTHAGPSDGAIGDAPGARTDGPADGPTDAPPDTPRESCMARWLDHTISFDTGTAIAELNTSGYERDPYLSPDETTVYFSSSRADSMPTAGDDIYTATRLTATGTFSTPIKYASASTMTGSETKMSITADGKDLFVGSSQNGGAGGVDVWEATGATPFVFGTLNRTHVMMVEDSGNQQDPVISANGLHLYLAPDTTGNQILVMASRPSATMNFSAPRPIAELNDAVNGTADPTLNADETVIVFASARTGTVGGGDLWYSTRATANDAWSTPIQVPGINTTASEADPHLGGDGCHLYFASDRDSGQNWDLFVATAQ
jgi:Tol biopolymer transport system component